MLARRFLPVLSVAAVLLLLVAACTRTVTPEPSSQELSAVWEAWNTIQDTYVKQEALDSQRLSEAAVLGMAKALNIPQEEALQDAQGSRGRIARGVPQGLLALWNFWRELRSQQPNLSKAEQDRLVQAAVRGMVESLGTPNAYVGPEELPQQQEQLSGQYEGVGATMAESGGRIVVVDVFPDSPAQRAGLRPGDRILAVDGQSVIGLGLEEGTAKVRGPAGTVVTLRVERGDQALDLAIERAAVRLPSIQVAVSQDNVLGYMGIATFYDTTGQEFVDLLFAVLRTGVQGLILDLRDNPGGSLDSAVAIASQFLEEDNGLVMYEIDQQGRRIDRPIEAGGIATDIPLVVLVNENTTSAAEVLAAAFQHYGRAPIIGVTTFGKGTVNVLRKLPDGSAIYLTVARWFTPDGTPLEGVGVEPDITVELTEEDVAVGRDAQLIRAIQELLALLP
jgi:carboxyl-terminal processing protease